ncbi:MAG: oligopeptide:H+ symporter [Thermoguttaceae bacterium]
MSQPNRGTQTLANQATLFGHPVGLYTLFFAEMWERFTFYGMRALLVLFLAKGFLKYNDTDQYTIYGAYTALVYMMPFFGGMLADRLLGSRRSVPVGAALMATGSFCLMADQLESSLIFYTGLGLLVVGNGFFKPNISNMVGVLYRDVPAKCDGGFTIFYMGINLGAAIGPLLCGVIGETKGWGWGFGLAAIGMLTGMAIFVAPPLIAQIVIAAGALAAAAGLVYLSPADLVSTIVNISVGIATLVSATIAIVAIHRGGLPAEAGAAPDPPRLKKRLAGILPVEYAIYLVTLLIIPLFVLLVSGGAPLMKDHRPRTFVQESYLKGLENSPDAITAAYGVLLRQVSTPAGIVLSIATFLAGGYLLVELFRLKGIARQRLGVVLILFIFCLLFFAFYEQAGSSMNNFTDRNVERVFGGKDARVITTADVGRTIKLEPTQKQLGYHNGKQLFTLDELTKLRDDNKDHLSFRIAWKVADDNVGMTVASRGDEITTSAFQSVNSIYILLLGLPFSALWTFLGSRRLEPSTPFKFALGLLQLGLGFVALWYGARVADARGMVGVEWLLLAYLLHTTGELCLSPVGLSMITKLSPAHLVSTVIGGWFLTTALSEFLGGIIAQFTRVGGEGAAVVVPAPIKTVHVYGDVFGIIAIASGVAALACFCLVPLLKRWMHEGEESS